MSGNGAKLRWPEQRIGKQHCTFHTRGCPLVVGLRDTLARFTCRFVSLGWSKSTRAHPCTFRMQNFASSFWFDLGNTSVLFTLLVWPIKYEVACPCFSYGIIQVSLRFVYLNLLYRFHTFINVILILVICIGVKMFKLPASSLSTIILHFRKFKNSVQFWYAK